MTTHSQEQLIHPKNVSTVAYLNNNNNNNNNRQQANLLFSPYVCNHNDNIIPDKRFELPLHCIMGDYKQLFSITVVLWDTVIYCSRKNFFAKWLMQAKGKSDFSCLTDFEYNTHWQIYSNENNIFARIIILVAVI